VRSTIELAHNLGLTVVAEGVAEQSALDLLVEYGCDGAQGFYLGRPATSEKLAELLMSSSTTTAAGATKRRDRATRAGVRERHLGRGVS
jgi:EAL domain-containing protein (putative c-di-GMP-specific phosphodiesterase class I)